MVETVKKFTPVQELKIRQLVHISKLLYDLDLEFRTLGKNTLEHKWFDGKNHRVETINQTYLDGLRKIRNNIYLALGQEGFTKEGNMILQKYLTPYDIAMGDKFKQKSVADQAVT
ncbi:hypothetical protein HYW46_02780 [Candidatus Daviesbacteria bacterium]|nr:hypothetical protein [Candidatus Daviesbacteria bacterium]